MGALEVSKGTVKSIYALGAKLGMVERGDEHEDALHMLVQGLTGKESVKELTPPKQRQCWLSCGGAAYPPANGARASPESTRSFREA